MRSKKTVSLIIVFAMLIYLYNCNFYYDPFPSNSIEIYTPSDGSEVKAGNIIRIKWDSRDTGDYLKIELFKNNTFIRMIDDSVFNGNEYYWNPSTELIHSNHYQIKITDISNPNIYAYSGKFLIFKSVIFTDNKLREIIYRNFHGIEDITTKELATLIEIDAGNEEIWNIAGIRNCINLEILDLSENYFYSIDDLKHLESLIILDLSDNNNILSFAPIYHLTNIKELNISYNQIENLSFLINCDSLTRLNAGSCNISNIDDLINKPKLEFINFMDNNIASLSSLSTLTEINILLLNDNNIIDIEPIYNNSDIAEGDILILSNNPLNEESINEYIPELINRGVNVIY